NDGASRQQCWSELIGNQGNGAIPGNDRSNHADRLPRQQSYFAAASGGVALFKGKGVGQSRIVVVDAANAAGGSLGVGVKYSRFIGPHLGDISGAIAQCFADGVEIGCAFAVGHPWPDSFVKGGSCGGNSAVHIRFLGFGDSHIELLCRRGNNVETGRRGGFNPFAVNKKLIWILKGSLV